MVSLLLRAALLLPLMLLSAGPLLHLLMLSAGQFLLLSPQQHLQPVPLR